MKNILTLISFAFMSMAAKAQNKTTFSEKIDEYKQAKLFTAEKKSQLGIKYPLYRVYEYRDKTGLYYCVLTESRDLTNARGDTTNFKIQALNFKLQNGEWTKTWEINDFILPERSEPSIWFWSKYIAFEDYDEDGQIEPIITYGTFGLNGYDDGRIKFIIYYKGKKYAIRHENGVLDDERETQIDAVFYELPATLQKAIQQIMKSMMDNEHAIFPHGWEKAMQQQKTLINER